MSVEKAKIQYNVNAGPAFPIDTLILMPDTCRLNALVDSLAATREFRGIGRQIELHRNLTRILQTVSKILYKLRPEIIITFGVQCPEIHA